MFLILYSESEMQIGREREACVVRPMLLLLLIMVRSP